MNIEHPFTILPLGDSALIINFGNVINESINKKVLALFYKLKALSIPCVKDIVPAYSSLAIYYDVLVIKQKDVSHKTAFEIFKEQIQKIIADESEVLLPSPRSIRIPVCYAAKYALDMNEIAEQKKLSADEIIQLHTEKKYRVYMIGFLPGFAYMGEVDERIAMPRKQQPRKKVEAGYVAIAGKQTGIYPLTSPGGWQIIGKTPLQLFNKEDKNPVLFQPGDEVEFYSISENEFTNYKSGNT